MSQLSKTTSTSKKSEVLQVSSPWAASVSSLPSEPGVYWFLDQKNKVIYVGKAKNLKSRVSSYKKISNQNLKTRKLIKTIHKLKYKILDTEIDALVVEAELIRIYQPKFNLRQKDDKAPAFIVITKDTYPKIKVVRKNNIPANIPQKNIFGPYISTYSANKVLRFIRKTIPFCNASDSNIKNKKPCFYYHLHLCPGVCAGVFEKKEYYSNIKKINLFLKGKKRSVIANLKKEINSHIKNLEFEQAQIKKNQIDNLSYQSTKKVEKDLPTLSEDIIYESLNTISQILKKFFSLPPSYKPDRIEGYDISNISGTNATGSMVVFINGKKDNSEYKRFKIKSITTPDDPKMIGEVLQRRSKHPKWGIPKLILIDGGKTQLSSAIKNCPWNIPIVSLVKNPDRIMIKKEKKYYTIKLGSDLGSNLLRNIRDESHRFAKNYHAHLRTKSLIS